MYRTLPSPGSGGVYRWWHTLEYKADSGANALKYRLAALAQLFCLPLLGMLMFQPILSYILKKLNAFSKFIIWLPF